MTRREAWRAGGVVLVAVIVLAVAWKLMHGGANEEPAAAATAAVTTAPVQLQDVQDTASAFGAIQGDPSKARTLSAPRALIVERVLVRPGEAVGAGTPLMTFATAPASAMAYRQALSAQDAAVREQDRVGRMFAEHLATTDQVTAARKALADARAALIAQTASGAQFGAQTYASPFPGVVATVAVAPGEHVAQDAALITLSAASGMVAQLGVEPSEAARVRLGQPVILTPVFTPQMRLQSQVSGVAALVDPASRMINVSAPAPGAVLPVGAAVSAEIVLATHRGLVVPRAAVAFNEAGAYVFVVRAGKARQVAVRVVGDHGDVTEVAGPLSPADRVAVGGAYELQDGMAVRARAR